MDPSIILVLERNLDVGLCPSIQMYSAFIIDIDGSPLFGCGYKSSDIGKSKPSL